ncbi:MAG: hypothetical protein GYA16_12220 [Spirochaetes bacterium]|nr:hypothetical protein [Spirochaetota bacterium]
MKFNPVLLTRLQLNIAPITLAYKNGIIQIILTNGASVVIKLNEKDVDDVMTMIGDNNNTVLILRNTSVKLSEEQKYNKEIQKLFGSVPG